MHHCVLHTSTDVQWISRAWVANQSMQKAIFTGLVYVHVLTLPSLHCKHPIRTCEFKHYSLLWYLLNVHRYPIILLVHATWKVQEFQTETLQRLQTVEGVKVGLSATLELFVAFTCRQTFTIQYLVVTLMWYNIKCNLFASYLEIFFSQNSKPKTSAVQNLNQSLESVQDKSPKLQPNRSISFVSELSLDMDICRICHCESEPDMPLISPCACAGSLAYVHQSCLQRWIKSSDTKKCELCKYEFIMESKMKPINKVRVFSILIFLKSLCYKSMWCSELMVESLGQWQTVARSPCTPSPRGYTR